MAICVGLNLTLIGLFSVRLVLKCGFLFDLRCVNVRWSHPGAGGRWSEAGGGFTQGAICLSYWLMQRYDIISVSPNFGVPKGVKIC